MNAKAVVKYKVYQDGSLLAPVGMSGEYSGEFPLEPVLVFWKACRDIPSLMPPAFVPPGAERNLEGIAKRLIQYEYRNFGEVEVVILGAECKGCNSFLPMQEVEYDGMCFDCWLDEGQPDRWVKLANDKGDELFQLVMFDDREGEIISCHQATEDEIIRNVDTQDFHEWRIKVFRIRVAKDTLEIKHTPVLIEGDLERPLYIKGTIDGKKVFEGWGTNH